MKENKIVRIKWVDSCTRSAWAHKERAREYEPSEVETTGFQVHRNRQKIVIALNQDEDGDYSDVITIPMSCVKDIKKL